MSTDRTLYLVRHGEAAASWGQSPDPGLSELGREQAQDARVALLESLGGRSPTIVSSPLLRAQQTAQPLAEALGLTPEIDDRFREIPSPAPLDGRQEWLRAFMRSTWSEQEDTLQDWRRRILEALQALPDHSVVFSHFLVINTIAGWQQQRDETLVFWPANASITRLQERSAVGGAVWEVSLGEQMRSVVN